MSKDTTARDRTFAAYYIGEARFNATRAAELCGVRASTRQSLQNQASEILKRPIVQQMIKEHVSNVEMTQAEMLAELVSMARFDHKAIPDLDPSIANAAAKLYDTQMRAKLTSLKDLIKHSSSGMKDQLEKLRNAFTQHRELYPDVSDEKRVEMFQEHVDDPSLIQQILDDLMKNVENATRLARAEAEMADPMFVSEDA